MKKVLEQETMAYPESGGTAALLQPGIKYEIVSASEDGNMAIIKVRVLGSDRMYFVPRTAVGLPE